MGGECGTGFVTDFNKFSVTEISEEDRLTARGEAFEDALKLWVYIAGDIEDVGPTIVVKIENAVAPTDESALGTDAGFDCQIVEFTFA